MTIVAAARSGAQRVAGQITDKSTPATESRRPRIRASRGDIRPAGDRPRSVRCISASSAAFPPLVERSRAGRREGRAENGVEKTRVD